MHRRRRQRPSSSTLLGSGRQSEDHDALTEVTSAGPKVLVPASSAPGRWTLSDRPAQDHGGVEGDDMTTALIPALQRRAAPARRTRRRWPAIALLSCGALLVAGAATWRVAAVPALVKFPVDLDEHLSYGGTFTQYADATTAAPLSAPAVSALAIERHVVADSDEHRIARRAARADRDQRRGTRPGGAGPPVRHGSHLARQRRRWSRVGVHSGRCARSLRQLPPRLLVGPRCRGRHDVQRRHRHHGSPLAVDDVGTLVPTVRTRCGAQCDWASANERGSLLRAERTGRPADLHDWRRRTGASDPGARS